MDREVASRDGRATNDDERDGAFVVMSEIGIGVPGAPTLEAAFRDRLGEVDGWPGFRRLEVWSDERDAGRYLMVSWWDDRPSFAAYMRSESHRRSHARIPVEPERPEAVTVTRYRVVAT